jgi:hypothetical protein
MSADEIVSFGVHSFTTLSMVLKKYVRMEINIVCFLLGNTPASEFYMPTFRNTLSHLHRGVGMKNDWG